MKYSTGRVLAPALAPSLLTGKGSVSVPLSLLFPFCLLLSACMTQEPAPQVVAPVQPAVEVVRPAPPTIEQRVSLLLRQAERALYNDRLLLPADDNAYDRFQAVLRLQPDNIQAKTGLQMIAMRYIEMGRTALRHSRLDEARTYARRARQVAADNPLLREFEQALADAQRHQMQAAVAAPRAQSADTGAGSAQAPSDNEYPLSVAMLSKRGDEIKAVLGQIAERLKRSDEVILIVARSDEEGRWLYREMKQAAEGYRIRGDIKVGSPPRVVVYPPI